MANNNCTCVIITRDGVGLYQNYPLEASQLLDTVITILGSLSWQQLEFSMEKQDVRKGQWMWCRDWRKKPRLSLSSLSKVGKAKSRTWVCPDHSSPRPLPGVEFATGILEEGGNMSTGQSGGSLQRQQILQAQCCLSVMPTTCAGIHEGPLYLSLRLEGHEELTQHEALATAFAMSEKVLCLWTGSLMSSAREVAANSNRCSKF